MKIKETHSSFPGLITTKLHPPQVRSGIVHRRRLFDKINAAPAKLILVAAPAGFGKSTLVLDWLRENKSTFAWLSLDDSDNDPRRFYQYLLSALQSIYPSFGETLVTALKGSSAPSSEIILTHLVNELHGFDGEISLVLDDYYFIEDREIHRAVSFFLEHLPSNVRLIIATRVDPLLPLHRMRVRGELTEIRERDLRFTTEEAREFFETMHIHLSLDDVQQLAARTEGWIAGLQLAAVSLHDVRDVRQYIDSFAGTNRYVLDYLLEEVLHRQTKEVQMFLLQTSILTRFNEDICNTITGGMNAQKIIDYLERSNLFLIPLDDRSEWFRYHHLFSELLQHRLRQLYPGLIEELYYNASVWFEERENFSEALNYALRVKNYQRAAYLLDLCGIYFLSRSELSTLINYERKIPAEFTSKHPRLLIVKAWALMLMHKTDEIDPTIENVENLIRNSTVEISPDIIEYTKTHNVILRAFVLRLKGDLRNSLDASRKVLDVIPTDQLLFRGLVRFNIGRIYMKQGYASRAIEVLEKAYDDNFKAGNYYVALAILAHTGYLYSITGSLIKARHKLEESLAFAESQNLASLPAAGYIFYQLGRVLYHQNELDDAIGVLERAVQLGELGNEPDIVCNALFASSWIYAIQGKSDKATQNFSRAEEIEKKSNIPVYEADIAIERLALDLVLQKYDRIAKWISGVDRSIPDEYTIIDEARVMLMIRYFVYNKCFKDALSLIDALRSKADERGRYHILLQLDVLQAISLWSTGKKTSALSLLNNGLQSSLQMGYKRVLFNIGDPFFDLLTIARQDKALTTPVRRYANELLKPGKDEHYTGYPTIPKYKQDLSEPLTGREQEVLYYLSQNYTNKQIASKLFVSLDTIKTHLRHIYGKLGVSGRNEAVEKARELELLRN